MRKVIEYTLVSADGVFEDPANLGFMEYRDDAYLRDGLGLLVACDAMLFGRRTYQTFAKGWPDIGFGPSPLLSSANCSPEAGCVALFFSRSPY